MVIKIKYFGFLTEVTDCEEETMNFSGTYISELLDELYIKHRNLKDKNFQIAQDQQLVTTEAKVTKNEIVLLPPFSGG